MNGFFWFCGPCLHSWLRKNKKFVYSAVRKGARAAEFEVAIQWLVDAGIVYKVRRINKPVIPLAFYEDFNSFKLYFLDCGLFGAIVDAPASEILLGSKLFQEYKGAFTESYVLQQLYSSGFENVYYFRGDNSRIEIDFLVAMNSAAIPIEVKAEDNLKGKSLKLFRQEHDLPVGVRFSMCPYREQENLINIPLYTAFAIRNWI